MISDIEKTNRPYADIFRDLTKLLITHPDKLKINESFAGTIARTSQSVICITISCDYEDRPQLIGRGGMRVKDFHQIMNLVSERRNERVNITISNIKSEPRLNKPLPSTPTWNHDDEVRGILERLLEDLTDTPVFVEMEPSKDRTNILIRVASRSTINAELLRILQQLVKGYGLIRGWKVYLTLQFLDQQ